MYLDITENELNLIYEEIMTLLGGFDVDVDLSKEEVLIALRNALLKFEKEAAIWQLQNQFINVYGMPAGLVLTNQVAVVNYNLVHQITDFFASMNRVGGKIPWHKDYITLEPGRQIYFLDKESSKPYAPGTRRIHRVMWFAKPEIFGSHFNGTQGNVNGDDVLYNNSWNFTNAGLNFGSNRLGFLGYTFDTILMMQAVETRNKIIFSEFYHNLSGDVLEITPMPGNTMSNIQPNTRLFYYYWDEAEVLSGMPVTNQPQNQIVYDNIEALNPLNNPNNSNGLTGLPQGQSMLIANPLQMKIDVVPWGSLSPWAQTFVKEMGFALCKYIQGSKWRKIQKSIPTSDGEYQIEFDYASLLSEAKDEERTLIENLRADFKDLNIVNLMQNQQNTTDAALRINRGKGRLWKIM